MTLGDDEAKRRGVQKTVLERQGPPTFNVAVEMLAIGRWRIHVDIAAAVDEMLAGHMPVTQLRTVGADGKITAQQSFGAEPIGAEAEAAAGYAGQQAIPRGGGSPSSSAPAQAPGRRSGPEWGTGASPNRHHVTSCPTESVLF